MYVNAVFLILIHQPLVESTCMPTALFQKLIEKNLSSFKIDSEILSRFFEKRLFNFKNPSKIFSY